ncbi:hypothetical protein CEXT_263201 [Caerostris extrusa]|uniref:Uncharacterized protein n=1 Tax=Caerostris extrusa TaxID=172846 RepID=A0AAV4UIX5_CAEEX|nr:hypothetical protein CEXT_263201 [Caerostris extrusa]
MLVRRLFRHNFKFASEGPNNAARGESSQTSWNKESFFFFMSTHPLRLTNSILEDPDGHTIRRSGLRCASSLVRGKTS